MKGFTTFIAILCVAVCLLGWLTFVTDRASESNQRQNYIEQADAWVEEGLYQRAIKNYKKAQATDNSLELGEKIAHAYALRYVEVQGRAAHEETYDEYVEALEDLLKKFPGNEGFTVALANLYFEQENYTGAYNYLKIAVDKGSESETIKQMLQKARYAFRLGMAVYNDVKDSSYNAYPIAREGKWGILHNKDGMILDCDYAFMGQPNPDGVYLYTDDRDSRLVDGDGLVLGIFAEKITDCSVFADGLIAATSGKDYSYYDEFAKVVFGGYEEAGTFCNGKAAVKQNGKWFLVDKNGETVSDTFAHIVLNGSGEYICNGKILAAESEGHYKIYDKNFKEIASLDFDEVGVLTADGIIAVAKSGKWGFVNTNGETVIEPQYEAARSFSYGLAAISKAGQWGFIDTNNEVVIDCQFTDVTFFNKEGSCLVRMDIPEPEKDDSTPEGTESTPTGSEGVENTEPTTNTENTDGNTTEQTTPENTTEEKAPEVVIYQEDWKMLNLYNGIVED